MSLTAAGPHFDRSQLTCPNSQAAGAHHDGHGWGMPPWHRSDRANFPTPPGLVADELAILLTSVGGVRKTRDLEQERRHTCARRASAAVGDTS
jgi:hypothetical protein